jgi:signal transduction histidine kinase
MIKTAEAQKASHEVIEMVSANDKKKDLTNEIEDMAASNNLSILITDSDGKSLYNADYIPNSSIKSIPPDLFEQYYKLASDNGGSAKIKFDGGLNKAFSEKKNEHFLENRRPEPSEGVIYFTIVTSGTDKYVVMIHSVLTPVGATVNTLKIQLICISLIMVLLSLVIAFLLARQVSKSMIKVSASAKELAAGNFAVEFTGKDYKEITELSNTLNMAAKELEKTENLRRELIANVSHDLRTPLTMIIAYSEVMRDLPGENSPENIQVVIDESKRLTNLVNDMLDISKLQAGVMVKNPTLFNLTDSIKSVLERYNKLKEQDGYIIDFDFEKEVMVYADEFKIYQVLYNLVNNAINYTGNDKTVTVRQIVYGNQVKIEVTDSGDGIAEEELPYVWDRYYKVDKTHKRAIAGTGLGLSIVKSILQLHESRYGVESGVGKGSTFWFTLETQEDN